jgi:hypothetical protein
MLIAVLCALAFVAVSALLARMLTVGNAERRAVVAVVRAQPDARRSSDFRVLRFDGPGGLPLNGREGTARIAWKAGRALPVVQCVKLRTDGNPVTGYSVRVLALGAPIGRLAGC